MVNYLKIAAYNPPIFKEIANVGLNEAPIFIIEEFLKSKGFTEVGARNCAKVFVSNREFLKSCAIMNQ